MQSSLQTHFTTLAEEVLRLPPAMISLTGGGGKTTLMYTLAEALSRLGNNGLGAKVLVATTTRIMRPAPEQSRFFMECDSPANIELPDIPCVMTAARPAGPGQKPEYLRGYAPEELDALWQQGAADWILVEADGSARKPLKAPIEKEPVIPSLSGLVIAVAGLSAVNKIFTDTRVFRPERFNALTGLELGTVITPESTAPLFTHPLGLFKGSPDEARRIVFLNQAETGGGMEAAIGISRALLQAGSGLHAILAGSARQKNAPCLRFVKAHALYEVFETQIKPYVRNFTVTTHFLPEGLSPDTGHLSRVELEGQKLYACLDFYEKGHLEINVMEKLGQDPLMGIQLGPGDPDKESEALVQLKNLLQQWEPAPRTDF